MGLTLSNFDAIFKTYYGPKIIELLNSKTMLLDMFEKDSSQEMVQGRNYVYPLHTGRNTGVGAIASGATLPVAGNQASVDVTIPYLYNYGRVQFDAPTMKQSMTKKGAFVRAMSFEMDALVKDVARDRGRQVWGFGVGIIARVNGNQGAGTVINIRSPGGVNYGPGVSTGAGRLLVPNQYVVFVRNATPTSAADTDIVAGSNAVQVSSVSSDGTSVTFVSTTGAALNDGDMIINAPAQLNTQSAVNKEVEGLLSLIDDGTYKTTLFGVSRTTYPLFKGTVMTANGNLSLDVLQRLLDLVDERGGKIEDLVFASHHSTRREYLNLLQAGRRFVGEQVRSPDGGFKKGAGSGDITYADQPWRVDRLAPLSTFFAINKNSMKRKVITEGEWANDDGTTILRVANQDSYEARFRIFDALVIENPESCGRIDQISTTFDYTSVQ